MGLRASKFREDASARRYVERILWPSGPVCPRCRQSETVYKLVSSPGSAHKLGAGMYKCARCRGRFSIVSNTIFAGSHIPLHKWLFASHLICSIRPGISALQLQHELELGSYRAAWFMARRIHWALDRIPRKQIDNAIAGLLPALLKVKPVSGMPRPGTRRQKSVLVQVNEELRGPQLQKKGQSDGDPPLCPRKYLR